MQEAIKITIFGRVQGVGFRPFIYQLAGKYNINGYVQNNMDGVFIIAEGNEPNIYKMVDEIKDNPPRLAQIERIKVEQVQFIGMQDFLIKSSDRGGASSLVIPVDAAICDDCLREIRDPNNFRYQYPFINCIQCGPRYTLISELPYDREFTSMQRFKMCKVCEEEYHNPKDRRHHAQPIACPTCGPKIELFAITGEKIADQTDGIEIAKELLREGKIIAIKGLGGYHLACDATNEKAIEQLRIRKKRPSRPLAIMVPSVEVINEYSFVSPLEKRILTSYQAPIVVLKQKPNYILSTLLAPGLTTIGVMLAYTPLHLLLFENSGFNRLVMTSANPSKMPILYQDKQVFSYLHSVADYVLTHNREILHAIDDSVVQVLDNKLYFIRRSRGYVPDPLNTNNNINQVIALGGQQKNTFAIGRGNQIFLSPHIGEIENIEVTEFFKHELGHLLKWLGTTVKKVAIDKHPNFIFGKLAKELEGKVIPIQHHHAHHVACMEDNQINNPTYGIILDGTGYGEDGNIWGFEFLYGDAKGYQRLAHLKYTPLPGNEKAIKEPWRNAVGMLIGHLGEEGKYLAKRLYKDKEMEINILDKMLNKQINSPLAGTCGRLYDAVSSMVGICHIATYDGEPAIRLSEIMSDKLDEIKPYTYELLENKDSGLLEVVFSDMLRNIVRDHLEEKPKVEIIQRFQLTVTRSIVHTMEILSEKNPLFYKQVVLSGGSFHNPFLLKEIQIELIKRGFQVYTHNKIPCNDGGLSLGQLIIAANADTEDQNKHKVEFDF